MKSTVGVNSGRRHDADVFGICRHPGAATGGGYDCRNAVAEKRAPEVSIEVAARHRGDRLDVPQVLGDQDYRHGRDQEYGVRVKRGSREFRQSHPWRRCERCVVDRLAPSQPVREQEIEYIAGNGADDNR
jgi:hypothetical protein